MLVVFKRRFVLLAVFAYRIAVSRDRLHDHADRHVISCPLSVSTFVLYSRPRSRDAIFKFVAGGTLRAVSGALRI